MYVYDQVCCFYYGSDCYICGFDGCFCYSLCCCLHVCHFFASFYLFALKHLFVYFLLCEVCLIETYVLLLRLCDITSLTEDNTMVTLTAYLLHAFVYNESEVLFYYIYSLIIYIQVPCLGNPNTYVTMLIICFPILPTD